MSMTELNERMYADLWHRSQSRRKWAFEYLAWAREDAKNGKMERASQYAQCFYDMMFNARRDLHEMRVRGFQPNRPVAHEMRRAA